MDAIPVSTLFMSLIVLLIVSAFFSISETSMMALNRYRLRHLVQSGNRGAKLASVLLANTHGFLGVVLLGNNLINAASALVVGIISERYLGEGQWTLFVATTVAGFAILVFSEITPKIVGATYPERIALPASYVLTPLLRFPPTRWILWFVNLFVQALLTMLRLKPRPGDGEQQPLTVDELRTIVLETAYLPQKHRSILLNLFDLEAITVDDVMVPRNQIEGIDLDAPLDEIRRQVATAHHRRLLVYRGNLDEVIGTLRVRDVNLLQNDGLTKEQLAAIIREPHFVPARTPLFSQLQSFQEQQDRVSLVVDEYGELKGMVTLEDILEEIIGEFATHSPLKAGGYVKEPDGSYLVEGGTLLRDLNRKLGYRFPLDGPKTLNGLILEYLQDIPEPNTSVKIADHALDVLQIHDRVVKAVRLYPPPPPQQQQ